jgi:cytochrome c oxidase subunit 2
MTTAPIPPSAVDWNHLFNVFAIIGWTALIIVVGAMVYFAARYRSKKEPLEKPMERTSEKTRVREAVIFASISIMLLLSLAIASYNMSADIHYPPTAPETLTVDVTAFQWDFEFHYPNNVTVATDCPVPASTPVIFNVTSIDVMHNFGLPDFKVKIDAMPGRYNILWINTPSVEGSDSMNYTIRCYELCGLGHTFMIGTLTVMNPIAFNQWLNQTAAAQSQKATGGT